MGGGGAPGGGSGGGGGTASCTNCSGCCLNGVCQTGQTDTACGRDGAACVSCGAGNVCSQGACCLNVASFSPSLGAAGAYQSNGNFDVGDEVYGQFTSPVDYDVVRFFQLNPGGARSATFSSLTTLAMCTSCVMVFDGCTDTMSLASCTGYLPQSGSISVTASTAADAGVFIGSVSNVRMVEWDLANTDTAVPNGRCAVINGTRNFTFRW